jgi:hypothetical protein
MVILSATLGEATSHRSSVNPHDVRFPQSERRPIFYSFHALLHVEEQQISTASRCVGSSRLPISTAIDTVGMSVRQSAPVKPTHLSRCEMKRETYVVRPMRIVCSNFAVPSGKPGMVRPMRSSIGTTRSICPDKKAYQKPELDSSPERNLRVAIAERTRMPLRTPSDGRTTIPGLRDDEKRW